VCGGSTRPPSARAASGEASSREAASSACTSSRQTTGQGSPLSPARPPGWASSCPLSPARPPGWAGELEGCSSHGGARENCGNQARATRARVSAPPLVPARMGGGEQEARGPQFSRAPPWPDGRGRARGEGTAVLSSSGEWSRKTRPRRLCTFSCLPWRASTQSTNSCVHKK